ncbi:hypothetical protein F4781DRAFT_180128 [Annulohypoxylon bovei var. microspora]|nr:hypothetical protein F4781DRAFT_180128 [Annulohypoxylon bovei var. microspora]
MRQLARTGRKHDCIKIDRSLKYNYKNFEVEALKLEKGLIREIQVGIIFNAYYFSICTYCFPSIVGMRTEYLLVSFTVYEPTVSWITHNKHTCTHINKYSFLYIVLIGPLKFLSTAVDINIPIEDEIDSIVCCLGHELGRRPGNTISSFRTYIQHTYQHIYIVECQ